jgi:hypothetical protein
MKVHSLTRWKTASEIVLFLVTAMSTSINPHKSLSHHNVAHQKTAKADFRFQTNFSHLYHTSSKSEASTLENVQFSNIVPVHHSDSAV